MLCIRRLNSIAVLLFCLLLPTAVSAATITGRITDASTGKPVVFATVRILETGSEVHTDADGQYIFDGVPAGRYTVAVTFAGYTDYSIGIVETSMEGQKTLNAALQPDIAPMYRPDSEPSDFSSPNETDHKNSLRSNPIRLTDMPIRGYEDFVAIQSGTVRRFYGAPVHVRGGRIEEFSYEVDGIPQQDPFTGRSFTAINGNTIDDIQFYPGYSDPSNGWLASGHAEVTTRETWATGGSFEAITDNFHGEKSDYNLYALDLSGPIIASSPGHLTYAVAGEYRTIGTREIGAPGDWNYLGAWHANLRWRPTDRTSTLIGTRGSYEDWKYSPREWYFNSEHAPRGLDENYSVFGKFEHDVAHRTKLSASASWFSTSHMRGDGIHFDDLWAYGRPGGNPNFDETQLFTAFDDMMLDQDSLAADRYVPLRTPIVDSVFTVELPNGETVQKSFVLRGDEATVWDDYFKQKGSYIAGSFALEQAHSSTAQSHVGFEFQRHSARAYRHLFPVNVYQGIGGGFDDIDRYGYDEFGIESESDTNGAKHPLFIAGFVNHSLVHRELTLNIGARWDRFDYDAIGLVDPQQPLDPYDRATYADTASGLSENERNELRQGAQALEADELTDIETISRLSPRVSAGLRLSQNFSLHFEAARHVQRPPLSDLYYNLDYLEYKIRTGGYVYTFGNPALEPTESVIFEVGATHELGDLAIVDLSVFIKDFKNLVAEVRQPAIPNSFETLIDPGDATVKGIELGLQLRPVRGISAQLIYTLSDITDDDQSYANTNSNIAWTSAQPPKLGGPFTFEQRSRFVGVFDLRTGPNDGPAISGSHVFGNAGVTALFEAGSGFPYSPVFVYNEVTLGAIQPRPSGKIGSERTPSTYRLDVKANKAISILGGDLEVYLWVINVFDRDNVADVYRGTGEPDNTGWLDTPDGQQFIQEYSAIHDASNLTGEQKYMLKQNDPANFDIPRQIRFGMRVGF